ncbi:sirohydrochlorin cobaltochelatase [Butyrivibrio sp. XPD2002]|uniref:sirohydrochlorin cobaltochelatase n=1 Tax=Butyrivibrio sp. XPD2002 TaxID=1280665 RepID=UPI0004089B2E|nr:sirohydrochlorin cobaltochelatase [Butyrivibrio sp. XPD2002]
MKRKTIALIMTTVLAISLMSGCGQKAAPAEENQTATETVTEDTAEAQTEESVEEKAEEPAEEEKSEENTDATAEESTETAEEGALEDGEYSAKFTTDSSMFHINEAYADRGTLTVKDGEMTIHITLPSKNIVNLFPGTAEDAQKDGAVLLEPTTDQVKYEDGTEEEVYGFDVPVPAIDEPFQLALIGTKGKWYDHEVTVSDVQTGEAGEGDDDMAAAKKVADLIDSIYVQTWTEETDSLCEEAKKAWDELTDAQKELVEGEDADPDYFGNDTGDASKDDPLNADDIGENELLVVSFGTSFNDSRAEDIGGIEKALAAAYPDWSVRRAFTAQIIINHVYARDGEKIDNVDQALQRAVDNGVKNLVVQPTHLMHGAEYDELVEALDKYSDKFESVKIAEPLLGEVGKDATIINEDKEKVAKAITNAAVKEAGFDSIEAADEDGTAFVFMGHGTSHTANVTYSQMQTQMEKLGHKNVFIGTVEGLPEETALDAVIEAVKAAGYKKVILRPLMVVAGDHANNDMAGDDEDSWKSGFEKDGSFESIECQIAGLGGISEVQEVYVSHTGDVIK